MIGASPTIEDSRGNRFVPTLVVVLLGLSVLLNMLLARKVASLRDENSRLSDYGRLHAGSTVPPLIGYSLSGTPISVRFDDVRIPTVIYVFSPQCGWCAKNLENFRSLISQAGTHYRVVGAATSRQDLDTYVFRERLTLPVVSSIDAGLVSAYHLGATPTTIVVSPQGKVLKVWIGAYLDGTRQEIEAYLGVHLLPCCESAPQSGRKS